MTLKRHPHAAVAAIVASSVISYAQASVFTPNCTIPPPGTSFVAAPTVRSTMSIVWNCLSVLLLCTWSTQHLNVPKKRAKPQGFIANVKDAILDTLPKAKWMVIALLMPEYLVSKAFSDWLGVQYAINRTKPRRSLEGTDPPSQNIAMGEIGRQLYGTGTDLDPGPHTAPEEVPGEAVPAEAPKDWGKLHIYLANTGYFVLDTGRKEENIVTTVHYNYDPISDFNIDMLRGRRFWALNNSQWNHLADYEIMNLPDVDEAILEKLGHGSAFVTILALLQIATHIIQLIARQVKGLPSTQIEIATLAFVVPSAIIYILTWGYPQGVNTHHVVKLPEGFSGSLEHLEDTLTELGHFYTWVGPRPDISINLSLGPIPIPNDSVVHAELSSLDRIQILEKLSGSAEWNQEVIVFLFGACICGLPFGGLHLLAWNSSFHTNAESACWKISSILVTIIPLLFPLPFWAMTTLEDVSEILSQVMVCFLIVMLALYIIARLFLLTEMFLTLAYLPPAAFDETWAGLLPRFS
ncbi:hypothetical protein TWF730_011243 [Orbilia blumenaviensis]|uniref:Uncharacterized protein n=1 Tax=Orbilia blumenaviensis TaxID=1796055 RepID=A0AAV9UNI9_9PEZI